MIIFIHDNLPIYAERTCLLLSIMCGSRKLCQRGSNSVKFFFRGARLHNHQKAGNYRPASEMQLKCCFAGGPIMVHIECWLGSYVIFKGSGPVFLGNPMNL